MAHIYIYKGIFKLTRSRGKFKELCNWFGSLLWTQYGGEWVKEDHKEATHPESDIIRLLKEFKTEVWKNFKRKYQLKLLYSFKCHRINFN